MRRFLRYSLLGAAGLLTLSGAALAFPPAGPWDAQPLDADVHPPAKIGAIVSGAKANATSHRSPDSSRTEAPTGVQSSCSLQIASATVPGGSATGRTIVLQSEVRGSIIQVCR
ncbi:MAG: hypothetical protein ACOYOH_11945 [Paracraurococcus sp.]